MSTPSFSAIFSKKNKFLASYLLSRTTIRPKRDIILKQDFDPRKAILPLLVDFYSEELISFFAFNGILNQYFSLYRFELVFQSISGRLTEKD